MSCEGGGGVACVCVFRGRTFVSLLRQKLPHLISVGRRLRCQRFRFGIFWPGNTFAAPLPPTSHQFTLTSTPPPRHPFQLPFYSFCIIWKFSICFSNLILVLCAYKIQPVELKKKKKQLFGKVSYLCGTVKTAE